VSAYIEAGMGFTEAVNKVVHEKLPAGTGGVVAVSPLGEVATPFNASMMNRGWIDDTMVPHTAAGEDDLGSAVLARDPLGLEGTGGPPSKL
jgi:isoaspartyl peptidase/L-asparaginase-like protein (Ntn-hydrolase superfamily)